MKTIKVSTWLPIFSGFYGTIWEANYYDAEIPFFDINPHDLEFNNDAYEASVSERICEVLQKAMSDLITEIEYEGVSSPRYYNFRNDAIDAIITVDADKFAKYIEDNYDQLRQYILKNYSSRDGFISHHSNNIEDWVIETKGFTVFEDSDGVHKFGSILHFIGKHVMSISDYMLYDEVSPCAELYLELPDPSPYMEVAMESYRRGLSREDAGDRVLLKAEENCDDDTLKVMDLVNSVYDEIDNKTMSLFTSSELDD